MVQELVGVTTRGAAQDLGFYDGGLPTLLQRVGERAWQLSS